jgi:hypothetical protein
MPAENLAARIISRHRAGRILAPDDEHGFLDAAAHFLNDEHEREQASVNGRKYAEQTFDINRVTEEFERLLT